MTKDQEPKETPATAGLSMDQFEQVLRIIKGNRIEGADLTAKVERIKAKEGEHARPEPPDIPPPGYCICTDQYGQGKKMFELQTVMGTGLTAAPFGSRRLPVDSGCYSGKVRYGQLVVKAFTPYADMSLLKTRKGGHSVPLESCFIDFGSQDRPAPMFGMYVKNGGTYFLPDYLKSLGG